MIERDRPYHPVSNLFPLMQGAEYDELKADIAANGLLEPIWLHPDQSIIDGRNRHRACIETGAPLQFRTWNGQGSLVSFVVSLNLHRRHLTPGQHAMIAQDVLPILEKEAKERAMEASCTKWGGKISTPLEEQGKTRDQAAAMFGVSGRYVQEAKRIKEDAPDLAEQVRNGEMSIPQAKRELKERSREQVREVNRQLVNGSESLDIALPDQRYSTIVLDPPWDWGDEGDCDQFGRARPVYATMPYAEVLALPVSDLAQDDAHIYLWITNRSLPKGFALLDAWGFRYITPLTWCKPSFGMGNYYRGQTEQVLFGVRGSLALLRHDVGTWFLADRPGPHSGKPEQFYKLIETCSPGPWLEMFARKQRPGWATWGAEINGKL